MGDVTTWPPDLGETQDAGPAIAHNVIAALPTIQRLRLFDCDGAYSNGHNGQKLHRFRPEVNVSSVKWH